MSTPSNAANVLSEEPSPPGPPPPPHPSSMSQRLGWIHRLLSRYAFAFVHVDAKVVERVRHLAERGTVVFVMRNRSIADYLLIRSVFLREGLPLPEFANELGIGWFRSLRWILARIIERLSHLPIFRHAKRQHLADRETAARLARAGHSILIFLRRQGFAVTSVLRPQRALESKRIGDPYLEDLFVIAAEQPVYVVPLAPFRGRGYRRRNSRLATLVYSVQEAPSELKKLLTVLFNRRDVSLTIGEEIDLRAFINRYGAEGAGSMVRRMTRALQLFLYREERVVWGPPLLPKRVVRELVLGQPAMQKTVRELALSRHLPIEKVRR